MNRSSYLEGLELLRQDFSVENGRKFILIVTQSNNNKIFAMPKETLALSACILQRQEIPEIRYIFEHLAKTDKLGSV